MGIKVPDCFGLRPRNDDGGWIASFLASSFSLAEKMTGLRPARNDGVSLNS
ncbi:MAG: hypothetical protein LBR18_05630 [Tannerella sp.]|nr:hypothetical protein [Tannerella sp.]